MVKSFLVRNRFSISWFHFFKLCLWSAGNSSGDRRIASTFVEDIPTSFFTASLVTRIVPPIDRPLFLGSSYPSVWSHMKSIRSGCTDS